MGRRLAFTAFLAALTAGLTATPTAAQQCDTTAPYLANYQFDQVHEVTAIAKYNATTCGSGISNSDTAPVGPSLLTDIFAKNEPVTRALLFGIATDLPGDPEGQQHLVLFTNDLFALRARNIAFGTLFPTSNEAALIAALTSLASGDGSGEDYGLLAGFAENAALSGPNGDAGFGLGDSFSAVAFSDGRIIGTGLFFGTAVGSVPEPATWALLILGFGATGAAMRRRGAVRTALA